MAQELRHELLFSQAVGDAAAEFRNDTNGMISIRGADYSHRLNGAAPDESAHVELSKAPVYQGVTANSPFFRYGQMIAPTTDVALDTSVTINGSKRWGRGQLTLEPNESLFLNHSVIGAPVITSSYELEYEFM